MQNPLKWMTPSEKIASLALVVSFIGTGLALWVSTNATAIARDVAEKEAEFRRLSSLPGLNLKFADGSDKDVIGIVLENTGLGPVRIANLQVYVAGQKVVSGVARDEDWIRAVAAVKAARPEVITGDSIRFSSFYGDFTIAAGESKPLFYVNKSEKTESSHAFIKAAGDVMKIAACMCSSYDECWHYRSPGLSAEPCDEIAEYQLWNTGPLAEKLKDVPRLQIPWQRPSR